MKTLYLTTETEEFIPELIKFDINLFSPIHWGDENVKSFFSRNDKTNYVIHDENKTIIAYGGLQKGNYYTEIACVAVNPEFRGCKFGEFFLLILIQKANQLFKEDTLYLYVKEDNNVARKLYEKTNFKYVKLFPNYYGEMKGFNTNAFKMYLEVDIDEINKKIDTMKGLLMENDIKFIEFNFLQEI